MKHKCNGAIRILALLLAAVVCLPFFAACKKDSAMTGEPMLQIDEKGKMAFSLLLDAETLQAHAGQTAYLYELLPGETIYDINSKPSMQRSKVSSKIKFSFDVTDENGTDRRCNSYLLTFSDGMVFSKPITLSNPEKLARNTDEFPRANTIKGLNAYDEDLASSLHSAHTLIALSTADLLEGGDTPLSWNGIGVSLNGTVMTQTDARVLAAARAGMQISIELTVGADASVSQVSALINILLDRYSDQKTGEVTALILKEAEIADAEDASYGAVVSRMATLMRVARISMISRVANGRVYLGTDTTLEASQAYAKAVYDQAKAAQAISFGVALYPDPITEGLMPKAETDEETADRNLLLSDVVATAKALTDHMGRSAGIAILDVAIPASDIQMQSALYAYAYRAASLAKADLLIYSSLVGEEAGLYAPDGTARPVAECFALADTDKNLAAEGDAADLLGEEWTSLKSARAVRVEMDELANVGAVQNTTEQFVDFSEGDTQGFTSFGRASSPTVVQSEARQTPVLATTITEPYYDIASGLRHSISDVKKLKDVHVLSANLLVQSAEEEGVEVFLNLEGWAKDGRALSLTSSVRISPDMWQSVSFHIRGFTVQMDTDKPCTMTLTVKGGEALPEEGAVTHTLLLHSVNVSRAEKDYSILLLVGMIAGGFAIGASVILLASRKRRRHGYDGR